MNNKFTAQINVDMANPNGDPANDNMPRIRQDGKGFITSGCIKRKLRNRLQDLGAKVLVQSNDKSDDGLHSIRDRVLQVSKVQDVISDKDNKPNTDSFNKKILEAVKEEFIDVRLFGTLLPFTSKIKDGLQSCSISCKGAVSISSPVTDKELIFDTVQITKSTNNEGDGKGSDTMGIKYIVENADYNFEGRISPQLKDYNGVSENDIALFKKALETLFVGDESDARPYGSMKMSNIVWQ